MKKILFFLLLFFSGSAFAAEEILNYDTEITVRTDASVIVRERITVQREGKKIKRGIYRDLPKTKGVTYDVLSVRRDNQPEPYFTGNTGSYFRINTGTDDFYLMTAYILLKSHIGPKMSSQALTTMTSCTGMSPETAGNSPFARLPPA